MEAWLILLESKRLGSVVAGSGHLLRMTIVKHFSFVATKAEFRWTCFDGLRHRIILDLCVHIFSPNSWESSLWRAKSIVGGFFLVGKRKLVRARPDCCKVSIRSRYTFYNTNTLSTSSKCALNQTIAVLGLRFHKAPQLLTSCPDFRKDMGSWLSHK